MRKRFVPFTLSALAFILCATLFALCVSVEAQQPKKFFRAGYLSSNTRAGDSLRAEGIRAAMREFGYVEGQNLAIEYRYADGKLDHLKELAADLVRLKVDVIVVAGGDTVVRPAMNATKTIPIVMIGAGSDPVKAGFVQSLAHPGGNVTGITTFSTDLGGKRLELLKEAVPNVARIAVLYDPAAPGFAREVQEDLPTAARALKLTIQPWEVRDAENLEPVFAALSKQLPDALYAPTGGPAMPAKNLERIADFAIKRRLPSTYGNRRSVDVGGLMFYGADEIERYRRVAYYVDRILKGAKAADMPIEQTAKFEFVINLKTAKQIGVTIPPNVLARADKVIK